MKNMVKLFGVIALVAVIGFSMAGCNGPGTDPAPAPTPRTVTYHGNSGTDWYTLEITENTGREAYTSQSGDSYKLTVKKADGTVKTSNGKVGSVTGGQITLQPSSANASTFTTTVSPLGITAINNSITFNDGTKQTVTTINPDPLAGTWESPSISMRMIAANGSYNANNNGGRGISKGTYTVSANKVTMTTVEVNKNVANGNSGDAWTAWNDLTESEKTTFGGEQTHDIPITNNSFTFTYNGSTAVWVKR